MIHIFGGLFKASILVACQVYFSERRRDRVLCPVLIPSRRNTLRSRGACGCCSAPFPILRRAATLCFRDPLLSATRDRLTEPFRKACHRVDSATERNAVDRSPRRLFLFLPRQPVATRTRWSRFVASFTFATANSRHACPLPYLPCCHAAGLSSR